MVSTPVFQVNEPHGLVGYGGLELVSWSRARELAKRGHEVTLVAPDGSDCAGVTIIPMGPAGRVDEATAYSKYWQHLLTVDCVVDDGWQKWSYILKKEGRLKAPVLGVCHAPANTMFATLPPVEKPCMVCISDDQRAHFEALHGKPARTAYNGVDTGFYSSTGVRRSDRFLFLARFSTIKNPLGAIEACKAAGVGLDLIGDTTITQEPDYFNHCAALCDGKQICMVGPATRSECVGWFSQAKAFIHPTKNFREPFGLAPVEAMLCGCPVIAWRYGAMKETVVDGVTGWLVDSEAQLLETVKHVATMTDADLAPMRQRCRDWAERFSYAAMGARYEELIQEALTTGGW